VSARPPWPSRPPASDVGQANPSRLPPPTARGATVIPGAVVARITERAAREALARQGGAVSALPDLGTPRSAAAVYDGSVRLRVSLALPYPLDIARTGEEIGHYIAERVAGLTGLRVDDITVSVRLLVPDESLRRERVR
jgi:hypothetical protein